MRSKPDELVARLSSLVVPRSHRYLVHGLAVESDVAFPIPETSIDRLDVAYRALGERRERLPARHSRSDVPEDPWVSEHWTTGHLVVEFPGVAMFEVSRDHVTLLSDDADDPDFVAHLLLDHVIPRLVSLRGDLMLHASGVVGPSGGAHLFVGPTGTGKSTMATALAATGWALLDDDGIRVIEIDGAWCAVPGYAGVRLLADSAAQVVPDLISLGPMAKGHSKHRYSVDGASLRMAAGPIPIAGIHVLERVDGAAPDVLPLGLAAALTVLTEHAFHMADEPTAITRHAFERASAVAARVPVDRLVLPSGLDQLPDVVAFLEQLDAS